MEIDSDPQEGSSYDLGVTVKAEIKEEDEDDHFNTIDLRSLGVKLNLSCSSRCRQATEAQLAALVLFLEREPEVARGHLKTAGARMKARRFWNRVGPRLNKLDGTTKTNKQWMKYWTDKKSNIKKKAAERAAALRRRRAGWGGDDIRLLTAAEERVLKMLGGEGQNCSKATAMGASRTTPSVPNHVVANCSEATAMGASPTTPSVPNSIVTNCSEATATGASRTTPSVPNSVVKSKIHPSEAETSAYYRISEIVPPKPYTSAYFRLEPIRSPEAFSEHVNPLASRRDAITQKAQFPQPPPGPQLATSPTRLSSPHVSPNLTREGATASSRPPSQRRSKLTSISERLLRIEERRLALEEKVAETNRIVAHAQRDMAEAVWDGISIMKAIAENFLSK